MKPYYENEHGKLYHGDCLEIMSIIGKVDLVLTDPPYGINEAAGKNKTRVGGLATAKDYGCDDWDCGIPDRLCFDTMRSISKHQIIFGGNFFVEYLSNSPCWLVWDKDNGKTDFADCELAWTNFKTAVRYFKFRWSGMLQEDMKNKEARYHPTQKPIKLFMRILLKYSKENQVILDPFLGSGTTALSVQEIGEGRKWIGIEKEEKYCEIAAKRIEQESRQMKLF